MKEFPIFENLNLKEDDLEAVGVTINLTDEQLKIIANRTSDLLLGFLEDCVKKACSEKGVFEIQVVQEQINNLELMLAEKSSSFATKIALTSMKKRLEKIMGESPEFYG